MATEQPDELAALEAIRTRSGLSDAWTDHVVLAPGIPLRLVGRERLAWTAALHGMVDGYFRSFSLDLEAEPLAADYKRLIAAVDRLQAALHAFGAGALGRAPMHPDGMQLWQLRAWAENGLEGLASSRPADTRAQSVIADLLRLYWHGFDRKPSRAPNGPTHRFINAFFDGCRNARVELIDQWNPNASAEPVRRRVHCPPPGTIPDQVRRMLPQIARLPLPGWWAELGLSEPSFAFA